MSLFFNKRLKFWIKKNKKTKYFNFKINKKIFLKNKRIKITFKLK